MHRYIEHDAVFLFPIQTRRRLLIYSTAAWDTNIKQDCYGSVGTLCVHMMVTGLQTAITSFPD